MNESEEEEEREETRTVGVQKAHQLGGPHKLLWERSEGISIGCPSSYPWYTIPSAARITATSFNLGMSLLLQSKLDPSRYFSSKWISSSSSSSSISDTLSDEVNTFFRSRYRSVQSRHRTMAVPSSLPLPPSRSPSEVSFKCEFKSTFFLQFSKTARL